MIEVRKLHPETNDTTCDCKYQGNAQDVAEELATLILTIKEKAPAVFFVASKIVDENYNKKGIIENG